MNWLTNWFFFLTSTFTVWPWKWHFLSENKNLPPTDDRVYVWRDDAIHLTSLWVHLGVVEWLQCQWDLGNAALTHGCHGSHGPCPFFFYVNRKALVPDPAVFSRPFFPDELGLPQVGSRVSASDQSVSDVLWSSILSPYIEQIGDGHGCGELPFFCWQHLKILSLM